MTDAEAKRLWALVDQWECRDHFDCGEYVCGGQNLETGPVDDLASLLTELGYPRPEGE